MLRNSSDNYSHLRISKKYPRKGTETDCCIYGIGGHSSISKKYPRKGTETTLSGRCTVCTCPQISKKYPRKGTETFSILTNGSFHFYFKKISP